LYRRVEDIDLMVGATLEQPAFEGSAVGNTFLCLISDQFLRLKQGDRFFYEFGDQPGSFNQGKYWSFGPKSLTHDLDYACLKGPTQ